MLRRTSSRSRDDVVAGDARAAAVGRSERAEHRDRRRLAGAVRAEEAEGLARRRRRSRCRAPPRPRRSACEAANGHRGRTLGTAGRAVGRRRARGSRRSLGASARARRRRGSGRASRRVVGEDLARLGDAAPRCRPAAPGRTRCRPRASALHDRACSSETSPASCSHGAGCVVARAPRRSARPGVGQLRRACARRPPRSGPGPRPRAAGAPGRPSRGSGARRRSLRSSSSCMIW